MKRVARAVGGKRARTADRGGAREAGCGDVLHVGTGVEIREHLRGCERVVVDAEIVERAVPIRVGGVLRTSEPGVHIGECRDAVGVGERGGEHAIAPPLPLLRRGGVGDDVMRQLPQHRRARRVDDGIGGRGFAPELAVGSGEHIAGEPDIIGAGGAAAQAGQFAGGARAEVQQMAVAAVRRLRGPKLIAHARVARAAALGAGGGAVRKVDVALRGGRSAGQRHAFSIRGKRRARAAHERIRAADLVVNPGAVRRALARGAVEFPAVPRRARGRAVARVHEVRAGGEIAEHLRGRERVIVDAELVQHGVEVRVGAEV